jgi:hypothetical protein
MSLVAWFGDFTIVWKPKTRRTRQLSLGMSGEEVRWLSRSLNALHGGAPCRGPGGDGARRKAICSIRIWPWPLRTFSANID